MLIKEKRLAGAGCEKPRIEPNDMQLENSKSSWILREAYGMMMMINKETIILIIISYVLLDRKIQQIINVFTSKWYFT